MGKRAVENLPGQLDAVLQSLSAEGIRDYYCGGAMGFDTLAAEAVVRLRARRPEIRLHLVLPCRNQTQGWTRVWRERYECLLEEADDVEYVSERYTKTCMLERNRRLVDYTTVCVAYLMQQTGGTAYTVTYARQREKRVYRLPG